MIMILYETGGIGFMEPRKITINEIKKIIGYEKIEMFHDNSQELSIFCIYNDESDKSENIFGSLILSKLFYKVIRKGTIIILNDELLG